MRRADDMTLLTEIEAAEAHLEQLRRQAAAAACTEVGHRWKFVGGRQAGCDLGADCGCSVPVHTCEVCGDCDYGQPAQAEIIAECAETRVQ